MRINCCRSISHRNQAINYKIPSTEGFRSHEIGAENAPDHDGIDLMSINRFLRSLSNGNDVCANEAERERLELV